MQQGVPASLIDPGRLTDGHARTLWWCARGLLTPTTRGRPKLPSSIFCAKSAHDTHQGRAHHALVMDALINPKESASNFPVQFAVTPSRSLPIACQRVAGRFAHLEKPLSTTLDLGTRSSDVARPSIYPISFPHPYHAASSLRPYFCLW